LMRPFHFFESLKQNLPGFFSMKDQTKTNVNQEGFLKALTFFEVLNETFLVFFT
jgi:hypothetical protein